jgi:hypothetical protein
VDLPQLQTVPGGAAGRELCVWLQFDAADTDSSGRISFDKFARSSHVLAPALALLVSADKRSQTVPVSPVRIGSGGIVVLDELSEDDEPEVAEVAEEEEHRSR